MEEKTKRKIYLWMIIIVVVSFLSGILFLSFQHAKRENTKKAIESFVDSQQYKQESTKPWDNGVWLGQINKENVEIIEFVDSWNETAEQAWLFDGIKCYYKDGKVSVFVGKNMKIKGTMNGAFAGLVNLRNINGFGHINTSEVTVMSYLFKGCESLESIDIDGLEMDNVQTAEGMFMDCEKLKELDMSNSNLENAENLNKMFYGCKGLNNLALPKVKNVKTMIRFLEGVGLKSDSLTTVGGDLNTPYLEDASYMFKESSLIDYHIAETMNTESLKKATGMFYGSSISELNLSKWNTENLETTEDMFWSVMSLQKINMDNWSVKSLKNCKHMFYLCASLTEISLGWEDVPNIKHALGLFKGCYILETIDVSCFDGLHFGDTREMFEHCEDLTIIYGSGFDADASDRMFNNCLRLKGKQAYIEDETDVEMANTEGYLSEKK